RTRRAKNEDVSGLLALVVDIDVKGPAHKKPNLPPMDAEPLALVAEMGLTPTIIVRTGHGIQSWWVFREPWLFEGDSERAAAASLSARWEKTIRLKAETARADIGD